MSAERRDFGVRGEMMREMDGRLDRLGVDGVVTAGKGLVTGGVTGGESGYILDVWTWRGGDEGVMEIIEALAMSR